MVAVEQGIKNGADETCETRCRSEGEHTPSEIPVAKAVVSNHGDERTAHAEAVKIPKEVDRQHAKEKGHRLLRYGVFRGHNEAHLMDATCVDPSGGIHPLLGSKDDSTADESAENRIEPECMRRAHDPIQPFKHFQPPVPVSKSQKVDLQKNNQKYPISLH
jgi:hypothetical protein